MGRRSRRKVQMCYGDGMTDDEVIDLLNTLVGRKVAQYQRREPGYEPPAGLPTGIDRDITALVWYVGAKPSRDELIAQGAEDGQVDAVLAAMKARLLIIEPSDLAPLPPDLTQAFARDLKDAIGEAPEDGPQSLEERVIREISEFRVEIYTNEGQHRGRPHVAVSLPGGKVSISLDDPPNLLTPHGLRFENEALKVVEKHRERLLVIWHETRPDDQKLPADSKPTGA